MQQNRINELASDLSPAVEFHEKLAPAWGSKYKKRSFDQRAETISKAIVTVGHPGETWLDAGCGVGTLTQTLVDFGIHAVGVDASPAMIQMATKNIQAKNDSTSAKFECIPTIEKLSFSAEQFDGIVCSSVIEYLDSPRRCLEEFHRVLKEGGHVVLTAPHSRSLLRILQSLVFKSTGLLTKTPFPAYLAHSKNHYSQASLVQLATSCGFEVTNIDYTVFWPSRLHSKYFGALMLCVLRKKRAA